MNFRKKIYVAMIFGGIGFICGVWYSFVNPSGNEPNDIAIIEKQLDNLINNIGKPLKENPKYTLVAPSMDQVTELVKPLVYENQQIAISKVLVKVDIKLDSNELPWNAPKWEDRYKYANKPWVLQNKYQLTIKSIGIGLISFFTVSVMVLTIILFLSWIWIFILERIKELSTAMRGK